jgi:hypothetical protein
MRRQKGEMGSWSVRQRLALAFVGLIVICLGAGSLALGHLHYANYWGGVVFAPYALLIGGLTILIAIVQGRGR